MAAGIFLDAARSVDHHKRGLGAGSAGDHVFEKFNVAGRVDDDVPALVRLEEAARRVDRDALILLVVRASSRKAYSNGFELRRQFSRMDSSLPFGSAPASARRRPITVDLP